MAFTPISEEAKQVFFQALAAGGTITDASKAAGICRTSGSMLAKEFRRNASPATPAISLPNPAPEALGLSLPEPLPQSYTAHTVDDLGWHLVLGDTQIPYHDLRTINAALQEAKAKKVVSILLNGDIGDCASISHHHKGAKAPRLEEELADIEQFISYVRGTFPRARIIYKEGNHEFRLPRYLAANAPEMGSLAKCQLPALLSLEKYGIEWVEGGRIVRLGRLPVVHGHEFGGGGGGVSPARWLFLRTSGTAACSHFHRTSEYSGRTIDDKLKTCWSVGCACYLWPEWLRRNQWNHGYALVETVAGGLFSFHNRKILPDGKVV